MNQPHYNRQRGFTLIETLIYIAFFAFLIGSLLGITFQTIASTDQINRKIVIQQESNFILRKLDWSLTGASALNVVSPTDLVVTRYSAPTSLEFKQSGNYLDLNTGSGFEDLNSVNVFVSNLAFTATINPPTPEEIQISFTLTYYNDPANPQTFQLTKYLKQ